MVTLPDDRDLEITVRCALPAGSAAGTSAAVVVALLGALDALTPGRLSPADIAAAAHRIETEGLGLQSGVQDQIASAHGGINLVVIDTYPNAQVARVPASETTRPAARAAHAARVPRAAPPVVGDPRPRDRRARR